VFQLYALPLASFRSFSFFCWGYEVLLKTMFGEKGNKGVPRAQVLCRARTHLLVAQLAILVVVDYTRLVRLIPSGKEMQKTTLETEGGSRR
jgi:hypothetical protein